MSKALDEVFDTIKEIREEAKYLRVLAQTAIGIAPKLANDLFDVATSLDNRAEDVSTFVAKAVKNNWD